MVDRGRPGWRAVRQLGGMVAVDALGRVAAQVLLIGTARLVGPDAFGNLVAALTVFMIASTLVDLGVGESLVQQLATRPNAVEQFKSAGAGARLLVATIATIPAAFVLILLLWFVQGPLWLALAFLPVLPAIVCTNRFLELRVAETFVGAAALSSAIILGQYGMIFAVAFFTPSTSVAIVALSCGLVFMAALFGRTGRQPETGTLLPLIKSGLPYLVTLGCSLLYTRGDRLVLAVAVTSTGLGLYAAAYSAVLAFSVFGTSIATFVLPRAARSLQSSTFDRGRVFTAVSAAVAVGLFMAVIVASASNFVISAVFTEAFAGAASILTVLSLLIPCYLANPILSSTINGVGRASVVSRIAVLNLALAVVTYPTAAFTGGVTGMAWASVGIELLNMFLLSTWLWRNAHVLART